MHRCAIVGDLNYICIVIFTDARQPQNAQHHRASSQPPPPPINMTPYKDACRAWFGFTLLIALLS